MTCFRGLKNFQLNAKNRTNNSLSRQKWRKYLWKYAWFTVYVDNQSIELDEHERILISEDVNAWRDNWNSYVKKTKAGERTLSNFVRTVSLGSAYAPDDKGVVLSTVHMAKGLEYDVVFIMGLDDGVFPDYRAINASEKYNDDKQLIEERHNMFVSITRSKRLCYVTYPLSKDTPWGIKYQKPSRYVGELLK